MRARVRWPSWSSLRFLTFAWFDLSHWMDVKGERCEILECELGKPTLKVVALYGREQGGPSGSSGLATLTIERVILSTCPRLSQLNGC